MGLIWSTVIFVLGLIGAILIPVTARLIGDDVKEWLPWITRRLIERAISRLPEKERERFEQEWWAHINDMPGNLAKVYVAWGCLSASKSIRRIAVSGPTPRLREATVKALDVVFAVTALFVMAPLLYVVALLVKLESPGPVVFRHQRIGARGQPFDLLTFRTVYVGTNGRTSGTQPRLTRVGRFLRWLGFDLILQLINVLKGEMSLVGPRPLPLKENLASDNPKFHPIKPGLTDVRYARQLLWSVMICLSVLAVLAFQVVGFHFHPSPLVALLLTVCPAGILGR